MSIRTLFFGLNKNERKELIEIISEGFKKSIIELSPDKRYLLLIPHDLPDEELEKIRNTLSVKLNLVNSNLKIAYIYAKNMKLLEF
jgi:hypothetical protein